MKKYLLILSLVMAASLLYATDYCVDCANCGGIPCCKGAYPGFQFCKWLGKEDCWAVGLCPSPKIAEDLNNIQNKIDTEGCLSDIEGCLSIPKSLIKNINLEDSIITKTLKFTLDLINDEINTNDSRNPSKRALCSLFMRYYHLDWNEFIKFKGKSDLHLTNQDYENLYNELQKIKEGEIIPIEKMENSVIIDISLEKAIDSNIQNIKIIMKKAPANYESLTMSLSIDYLKNNAELILKSKDKIIEKANLTFSY